MAGLSGNDEARRHETGFKQREHTDQPEHRSGRTRRGILKARHFDFSHGCRPIVREHVYPIVLRHRSIDRPGLAGKCKATHPVEFPHAAPDKGVQFTMQPTKQPWGGFMAMFTDPDGNVFYLDQLRDE